MATTLTIPLKQIPSQKFYITLGSQNCTLKVYQKDSYVYVDCYIEDTPVFLGVRAINGLDMRPGTYVSLKGSIYFEDQNGEEDPDYTGFGDRWLLKYVY